MDRILKKWFVEPRSDCGSGTGLESMGFYNVISLFAMMGVGLLVSIVILFLEICVRKVGSAFTSMADKVDNKESDNFRFN